MRVDVRGGFAGLLLAALVSISPAAAQQEDYRMAVINGSNIPIETFQFSECSSNDWRADRLGATEVIGAGASRVFDMYDGIRDCCRDLLNIQNAPAAKANPPTTARTVIGRSLIESPTGFRNSSARSSASSASSRVLSITCSDVPFRSCGLYSRPPCWVMLRS